MTPITPELEKYGSSKPKAIVTIPPHAPFLAEVAAHPAVAGLRLNTVMPVAESLESCLSRLKETANGKDLWVDLKGRQLRVKQYSNPPFTEVELSHNLTVDLPTMAFFSDGKQYSKVLAIKDGNKLILQESLKRVLAPGESVNIPHASLQIDGYLTQTDKDYIKAGAKVGITHYMLSFVESPQDITEFKDHYTAALKELNFPTPNNLTIAAKIESHRGLEYVKNQYDGSVQLMNARGDLYVELCWGNATNAHDILRASKLMAKRDPNAIVASRILSSLADNYLPSCADISDLDSLVRMGYKNFMLGDEVCQKRDSVMSAINCFDATMNLYN